MNSIQLEYHLTCDHSNFDLSLTRDKTGNRVRNLWEGNCFEIFYFLQSGEYKEWNFAWNGDWNCYTFTKYRYPAPPQECKNVSNPKVFTTKTEKGIKQLVHFYEPEEMVSYNLTAVILEKDNRPTHYAIKHLKDKPDFHEQSLYTSV